MILVVDAMAPGEWLDFCCCWKPAAAWCSAPMLRKTAYQFVGTRSIHMRTHLFLLDAWHWGAFIAAHSYFRRWRGAWRKTARFVVQIFWKFSCAQLVSRRNIAQQFLACETVGFEAWFWAQRHSLLQDCPFSSKPWAWTGSFLQVAI